MRKAGKKVAALLIAVMMLAASMQGMVLAAAKEFSVNTMIEAEDGTLSKEAKIVEDANASGKKAVYVEAGGRLDDPATLAEPDTTFTINVAEDGVYTLWIKYSAQSGGQDSLYVAIDNKNYINTSPGIAENYKWFKTAAQGVLKAGKHTIDFKRREPGLRLDQVVLTNDDALVTSPGGVPAPAAYVAPNAGAKDMVYPAVLDKSVVGTVKPYEKGDRIVFIGDSITHGGSYHANIFTYYATRYPDSQFTYINSGINGDVAGQTLSRLGADVFSGSFTKAVLMLGMNDMSRRQYFVGLDDKPGQAETRANLITTYKTNMKKIVDALKEKNISIVMAAPSPFDDTLATSNNENSPNFNNVLRTMGAYIKGWAEAEGMEFVDFNTPMLLAKNYYQAKDEKFSLMPDRIHPNTAGHYLMAYTFLKSQGQTGEVATVEVDAAAAKVSGASNCTAENLIANASSVKFDYTPKALPLPADAGYRDAEKIFPVTAELNREVFKVSGLKSGSYKITMDGKEVMKANATNIEKGVNIADAQNNPGQQQALALKGLVDAKVNLEKTIRDTRYTEQRTLIPTYKLDATSNETLIASAEKYIAENKDNPEKEKAVNELTIYVANKKNESKVYASIADMEKKVYGANKTMKHTVAIEYVGAVDTALSIAEVNYAQVTAPTGTVPMVAEKYTADNGSPAAPAIVLKDIDGHWANAIIKTLVEKKIVSGDENGFFQPDANVDVDAFIKMVDVALGYQVEVGKDYWASNYIEKAIAEGLVKAGEFETYQRPINRYEMARIIMRGLKEQPVSNAEAYSSMIPDFASIPAEFQEPVLNAYSKGIIVGADDGSFLGGNNATRAEAATVILRLIDSSARKPAVLK